MDKEQVEEMLKIAKEENKRKNWIFYKPFIFIWLKIILITIVVIRYKNKYPEMFDFIINIFWSIIKTFI